MEAVWVFQQALITSVQLSQNWLWVNPAGCGRWFLVLSEQCPLDVELWRCQPCLPWQGTGGIAAITQNLGYAQSSHTLWAKLWAEPRTADGWGWTGRYQRRGWGDVQGIFWPHHSHSSARGGDSQAGVRLWCQATSDRRRGHGLKLLQGRFRLDIGKKFLTEAVEWDAQGGNRVTTLGSIQERTGDRTLCSGSRWSVVKGWTQWSQSSFQTLMIL